jgi:hypothetical protein
VKNKKSSDGTSQQKPSFCRAEPSDFGLELFKPKSFKNQDWSILCILRIKPIQARPKKLRGGGYFKAFFSVFYSKDTFSDISDFRIFRIFQAKIKNFGTFFRYFRFSDISSNKKKNGSSLSLSRAEPGLTPSLPLIQLKKCKQTSCEDQKKPQNV